jgi:hypothetical protein
MAAAPIFRQTPVADETPREFPVCFPPGTIFRLSRASDPNARITALVKNDGCLKLLRYNEFTHKNPEMAKVPTTFHNMTPGEFLGYMELEGIVEDATIVADVKPPRAWFTTRALWTSLGGRLVEGWKEQLTAACEKRRNDWRAYLEQLQALYPIFKTIETAPEGTSVPLRMTAPPQPREVPEPQPQAERPTLLMPPSTAPQPQAPETITLTRDDMAYIYTMASGRAFTDDVWASLKQLATR